VLPTLQGSFDCETASLSRSSFFAQDDRANNQLAGRVRRSNCHPSVYTLDISWYILSIYLVESFLCRKHT
jgi:hypothetical protein